jgi:hypothetical protein
LLPNQKKKEVGPGYDYTSPKILSKSMVIKYGQKIITMEKVAHVVLVYQLSIDDYLKIYYFYN